jgi:ribose transport system permease protein
MTAGISAGASGPKFGDHLAEAVRRYGIVLALLVLSTVLGVVSPSFFRATNFANILAQWAPVGIMAVGTTYVILAGGFDLSVAAGFAFCAVVAAALGQAGAPPSLAFLAAVASGVAIGLVNAILVVGLRINPFVATLASGFVLTSLPFVIVDSPFIEVDQPGFDSLGTGTWHGIPYTGLILIGFLVIFGTVQAKTQYGHLLYAVGGNAEVSRLFGIPVRVVVGSTYVFSGFCVGVAASLSTSQLNYSASDQDPALVFDVIVAVVVGGTSLAGGIGSMWQTAIGLAILAVTQNGLNLLDINTFYQYIVKGCLIIGAVTLDVWIRRPSDRRPRRSGSAVRRVAATRPGRGSPKTSRRPSGADGRQSST